MQALNQISPSGASTSPRRTAVRRRRCLPCGECRSRFAVGSAWRFWASRVPENPRSSTCSAVSIARRRATTRQRRKDRLCILIGIRGIVSRRGKIGNAVCLDRVHRLSHDAILEERLIKVAEVIGDYRCTRFGEGLDASGEIGFSTWMKGSSALLISGDMPIMKPSGMATRTAMR